MNKELIIVCIFIAIIIILNCLMWLRFYLYTIKCKSYFIPEPEVSEKLTSIFRNMKSIKTEPAECYEDYLKNPEKYDFYIRIL